MFTRFFLVTAVGAALAAWVTEIVNPQNLPF